MLKFFFPDLRERAQTPELMDLPEAEEQKLFNTLRQFTLSNFLFSRARGLMRKYFLADMRRDPQRIYTLLDLGSGACDLSLWFLRECTRQNLKIRITCLEIHSTTVAYARKKCQAFPEIEIREGSALDLSSLPPHDYIFANHFLHHLAPEQIPALLDQLAPKTKRCFLLNDIRRSYWAYWGFTLLASIWAHNSFTLKDGRLSIQKGFTLAEIWSLLARCAAREQIKVLTLFPARIVLLGQSEDFLSKPQPSA
jgi:hypothetical protein